MNSLCHLAIIMDGNGRWAKERKKPRKEGHKAGTNVVREITTWCAKNAITYLTLYAFSTENWKRPKTEVRYLMKLLAQYLEKEKQTYLDHDICFKAIGNIEAFDLSLKEKIYELQSLTQNNKSLTQILALNYGSRDEITRALKDLLLSPPKNLENLEEELNARLDTRGIPDVDLLIRTGGEQRISNFLLWQISYAELFFTPTYWPEFSTRELEQIIASYRQKNRRFGGL
ncbi:undecaprenyl pyrophosphate synthetase [Helicobacter mustelae]|uniref:di-trans,poly-cis-decaprenylcistransferase n=1 Tax=Helicobacter mustelae TaxID=217 RepID=UPI000E04D625|nr:di-trans,poly-cis-decaprenylcistransferase [Helicobacter mustelae]STP13227.1 undecaprenyl pyrophosphate synthetase [Helicobacter mustelae]